MDSPWTDGPDTTCPWCHSTSLRRYTRPRRLDWSAMTVLTYARDRWQQTYAVVVDVRDHDEQLTVETLGASLRDQQVVRPSAAAEIELGQLSPTLGTRTVQIPVRSLERYGHRGVGSVAGDCVLSLFHWNLSTVNTALRTGNILITVDFEPVQFNEHQSLVSKQPGIASFVKFRSQENSASAFSGRVALYPNPVGERFVL